MALVGNLPRVGDKIPMLPMWEHSHGETVKIPSREQPTWGVPAPRRWSCRLRPPPRQRLLEEIRIRVSGCSAHFTITVIHY